MDDREVLRMMKLAIFNGMHTFPRLGEWISNMSLGAEVLERLLNERDRAIAQNGNIGYKDEEVNGR